MPYFWLPKTHSQLAIPIFIFFFLHFVLMNAKKFITRTQGRNDKKEMRRYLTTDENILMKRMYA